MAKKILLVDDSALMRSILGDIINKDSRFHVEDKAKDGSEALELLRTKKYDAMVLDINMPVMNGFELMKKLREEKIVIKVMISSTDSAEGSKVAMDALEAGAVDFVQKPDKASIARGNDFAAEFLKTLAGVCESVEISDSRMTRAEHAILNIKPQASSVRTSGNKIVCIASSTGGPRSLQSVIPKLPGRLNAPVVVVQHMPEGFTHSLAVRLDSMSEVKVQEAKEGEEIKKGNVYIAKGGTHMVVNKSGGRCTIHFKDAPPRESVKPCANYTYESLADTRYDEVVCVVLTGMGQDGTEGILNLKKQKKTYVISQNADTCIVYGMPKAVEKAGLSNTVLALGDIAEAIVEQVGVQ